MRNKCSENTLDQFTYSNTWNSNRTSERCMCRNKRSSVFNRTSSKCNILFLDSTTECNDCKRTRNDCRNSKLLRNIYDRNIVGKVSECMRHEWSKKCYDQISSINSGNNNRSSKCVCIHQLREQ